jgi:hypothetical protein
LGGGSFTRIRASLLAQLADLEAQREVAESTDRV